MKTGGGLDFPQTVAAPTAAHAEGIRFLRGGGFVSDALKELADALESRGIAYTVIGAAALNQHGYRRYTEDIDILLSPDGLERFHAELVGQGLSADYAGELDVSVRAKFRELHDDLPDGAG